MALICEIVTCWHRISKAYQTTCEVRNIRSVWWLKGEWRRGRERSQLQISLTNILTKITTNICWLKKKKSKKKKKKKQLERFLHLMVFWMQGSSYSRMYGWAADLANAKTRVWTGFDRLGRSHWSSNVSRVCCNGCYFWIELVTQCAQCRVGLALTSHPLVLNKEEKSI